MNFSMRKKSNLRGGRNNSVKRNNSVNSVKKVKRGKGVAGNRKPSFAAKLGAFMLENAKGKIVFNKKTGFTRKHKQVFGVLPYLHMDIKEKNFFKNFKEIESGRAGELTKLCNKHNLERKLSKVKFSCKNQSLAGVQAVNDSILSSINDKWAERKHGRKQLEVIQRAMEYQCSNNIIPSSSLQWTK